MITELTPEQEAQLEIYAEKWRNIGLSTEPANRPEAEKGVRLAYESANFNTSQHIYWFDSPAKVCQEKLTRLRDGYSYVGDEILRSTYGSVTQSSGFLSNDYSLVHQVSNSMNHLVYNSLQELVWISVRETFDESDWRTMSSRAPFLYGQHDAPSLSTYEFFHNVLPQLLYTRQFNGIWTVSQNAGWWIPFTDICLISERHTTLHLDDQNRPHCEGGLAIGYPDGWGVYAWHGVRVPEYVIIRPDAITPDKIMNEANAEVARVMIERYGQDNFIRDGGFSIVQSDDYGDLYRVEFDNNDEPIVAVHVKDASSDRDYFLYVPPHIRSAHEGVAWTFGYDNVTDYNPDDET